MTAYPSQIANILATIRYIESRGNYGIAAQPRRGVGRLPVHRIDVERVRRVPPRLSRTARGPGRARRLDVQRFLQQWNNDVSMIPVMWYYPRASRDVALMDIVPVPSAGNVLTVREYQQRGSACGPSSPASRFRGAHPRCVVARFGLPPDPPAPTMADPATPAEERTASVAFPVLGPTRLAAPDCGDATGCRPERRRDGVTRGDRGRGTLR